MPLIWLFLTLLVVSSLGQEDKIIRGKDAASVARKQLETFLKALATKDKDTIAKLFASGFSDHTNIDQIISQFEGASFSVLNAHFQNEKQIESSLKLQMENTKANFMWLLEKDDASPTGWKVDRVGNRSAARHFDFSGIIWCWADVLRCMGNMSAQVFG
uniref:DUF4440 domain-containing protein n=1 Tax=Caenorhabditis tropicalis TaxID=1561998 RepID=A0A1I7ULJ2_9PELO